MIKGLSPLCKKALSKPLQNSCEIPRISGKQIVINKEIGSASIPCKVLDVVERNYDNISRVNLITALHRIAKKHKQLYELSNNKAKKDVDYRLTGLLFSIHKDLINTPQKWGARDVCNTLWSLSTLSSSHEKCSYLTHHPYRRLRASILLFEHLLLEILSLKPTELHPQHIGMSLWAIAKLYRKDNKLLKQVAQSISNPERCILLDNVCISLVKYSKQTLPNCTPQHIANISWSLAKLEQPQCSEFLRLVENSLVSNDEAMKLEDYDNQSFSNFLWAFATSNTLPSESLIKLSIEVLVNRRDNNNKSTERVNEQNLSNIVWSIAHFRLLSDADERNQSETKQTKHPISTNSFDIASYMLTLSFFFCESLKSIVLVNNNKTNDPYKFSSLEISNIFWAIATYYKTTGSPLVSTFAEKEYSMQRNLLTPLFDLLISNVKETITTFCSQNIGNTLWACAKLGIQSQGITDIFSTFHAKLSERRKRSGDITLSEFNCQELANVLWAFACVRILPGFRFLSLYTEAYGKILKDRRDNRAADHATMTIWAVVNFTDIVSSRQVLGEFEDEKSSQFISDEGIMMALDGLILLLTDFYSQHLRLFTRRQKNHVQSSLSQLITLLPQSKTSSKVQETLDNSSW